MTPRQRFGPSSWAPKSSADHAVPRGLAAVELLVDAGDGEPVELLDGSDERAGRHADLLGEFLQRVGPYERTGLQPRRRRRTSRAPAGRRAACRTRSGRSGAGRTPSASGRCDTADARSAREDLVAGPVVREALVHEPLARLVHPDAAPHHRVEDRLARRGRRCRARTRPRRAARCRRRCRCPASERVAGVARHAHRPFVGDRRLVLLA